ncbi:MAG: pseudouridine-5'-phosphate glycosidase [Chloroflexi bacterium]|nr:pseudouridine-5'-phosphate glycosidase [Chloroflexota bacterium]
MVVVVKLHAGLRRLAPQPLERGEVQLDLPDSATLQQLLQALGLPEEQVLVALVNGRAERDLAMPLHPGDRVALIPPVAGGSASRLGTQHSALSTQHRTLPLLLSEEVQRAQRAGLPVVALESTVLAHGLPWPRNLEVGLAMEDEVRRHGAAPATIALLDGQLRVGLSAGELERVAREPLAKASRRDLAALLAAGASAATTVAGTLVVMQAVGLSVLATGGIGGVHRGAAESFDVSADLPELAHARAVVVCAGAKMILDLERTLEVLETLGVPVLGFQTDDLPAFYARQSGLRVSTRVETAEQAARTARVHWSLPGSGGLVLAVPIPEAWALPREALSEAIDRAIEEARRQQVRGAALTPFLLRAIAQVTGGRSVEANAALLRRNASVAAQVAVALSKQC